MHKRCNRLIQCSWFVVYVCFQWSGDKYAGQSDLHSAAEVHRWRSLLDGHLRGHRGCWLWLVMTISSVLIFDTFTKVPQRMCYEAARLICECFCTLSSSTVSFAGIWHCYWEYSSLKGKPDSDITISDIGFQTDFRVYLQLSQTWLIFSEISSIIPLYKCL